MTKALDQMSLFERLKKGLEEGIRFAKGELTLRTTNMVRRPPALYARDIVMLRRGIGMSQAVFAQMLNVSIKTIQSWEQGGRKPSQAALRLLELIKREPSFVCGLLGISQVADLALTDKRRANHRRRQERRRLSDARLRPAR